MAPGAFEASVESMAPKDPGIKALGALNHSSHSSPVSHSVKTVAGHVRSSKSQLGESKAALQGEIKQHQDLFSTAITGTPKSSRISIENIDIMKKMDCKLQDPTKELAPVGASTSELVAGKLLTVASLKDSTMRIESTDAFESKNDPQEHLLESDDEDEAVLLKCLIEAEDSLFQATNDEVPVMKTMDSSDVPVKKTKDSSAAKSEGSSSSSGPMIECSLEEAIVKGINYGEEQAEVPVVGSISSRSSLTDTSFQ